MYVPLAACSLSLTPFRVSLYSCSIFMSALGGLIVASVLKYADSIVKGYATSISVILTGMLSMLLFGTTLGAIYFLGIVNVVTAVLLYNGKDLDAYVCG